MGDNYNSTTRWNNMETGVNGVKSAPSTSIENDAFGTGTWSIQKAEKGLDMFFLGWALLMLNSVTIFLAVPWTSVIYYNAWSKKVSIDGRSVKFTGNAGGFFLIWVKTLVLSVITLTLYWFFVGSANKARWVDSNLSWE